MYLNAASVIRESPSVTSLYVCRSLPYVVIVVVGSVVVVGGSVVVDSLNCY